VGVDEQKEHKVGVGARDAGQKRGFLSDGRWTAGSGERRPALAFDDLIQYSAMRGADCQPNGPHSTFTCLVPLTFLARPPLRVAVQ